jgi:hypothetical protein
MTQPLDPSLCEHSVCDAVPLAVRSAGGQYRRKLTAGYLCTNPAHERWPRASGCGLPLCIGVEACLERKLGELFGDLDYRET